MKHWLALFVLLLGCSSASAADLRIEEVTSNKGIKAWLVRDDKLPLTTISFIWHGGVEQDPVDKQGLAFLATNLLTEGAGNLTADAFQQKLADNTIQLQFSASRDILVGSLKTLNETRTAAFRLLKLAISKPRFDDAAIQRARNQQLVAIKQQLGDAGWQGRRAMFGYLFPNHPYSQRYLGTAATLANITGADIHEFIAKHLALDNLVIGVAGAISPTELTKALDEIFGDLPAKAENSPVRDVALPEQTAHILVTRDGAQSEFLFALPAPHIGETDWYEAELANYLLGGGGFASRLMHKIRDEAALTYGISTGLSSMDHSSLLIGSMAVDNAKAGAAWDLLQKTWADFYQQGPSENELTAAKNYLTGAAPLSLTSTNAIAAELVAWQRHNLGKDYLSHYNSLIRNVTLEDIHRAIRRWFNPESLALTIVGQPEGITPTATIAPTRE